MSPVGRRKVLAADLQAAAPRRFSKCLECPESAPACSDANSGATPNDVAKNDGAQRPSRSALLGSRRAQTTPDGGRLASWLIGLPYSQGEKKFPASIS